MGHPGSEARGLWGTSKNREPNIHVSMSLNVTAEIRLKNWNLLLHFPNATVLTVVENRSHSGNTFGTPSTESFFSVCIFFILRTAAARRVSWKRPRSNLIHELAIIFFWPKLPFPSTLARVPTIWELSVLIYRNPLPPFYFFFFLKRVRVLRPKLQLKLLFGMEHVGTGPWRYCSLYAGIQEWKELANSSAAEKPEIMERWMSGWVINCSLKMCKLCSWFWKKTIIFKLILLWRFWAYNCKETSFEKRKS